jgi:hypothetical protein
VTVDYLSQNSENSKLEFLHQRFDLWGLLLRGLSLITPNQAKSCSLQHWSNPQSASQWGVRGSCPRAPDREGAPKVGGKKKFYGTSQGGDRGVASGCSVIFFMDLEIESRLKSNDSTKKQVVARRMPTEYYVPGGATNTTLAPGRQKPSRRHWLLAALCGCRPTN